MPSIQPKELWEETGRWEKFGGQLLKIKDRKEAEYCYGPTHEEVITDFARNELASYKQLPVNFYQIQTKFRDEIRPRFGVMRAREFLMKDAYSFHLTTTTSAREYQQHVRHLRPHLHPPGPEVPRGGRRHRRDRRQRLARVPRARRFGRGRDRVLQRFGLRRQRRTGRSGCAGRASRPRSEAMRKIDTPTQKTCEDVAALMGIALRPHGEVGGADGRRCRRQPQFVLALVRGDHVVNEIKLAKLAGLGEYRLATEAEIDRRTWAASRASSARSRRSKPIRVDRRPQRRRDGRLRRRRQRKGLPPRRRQLGPRPARAGRSSPTSATSSKAIRRPTASGTLGIARGIEVGHVFQLGRKYAEAMELHRARRDGKAAVPAMGCYGIGVSRIVAAAIEQNYDANGIIWPEAMAPWQVAVCMINPKNDAAVTAAAEALYRELNAAGIDAVLDDRGLRPGAMFADIELIGIPHRVVVSERGLAAGTLRVPRTPRERSGEPRSRGVAGAAGHAEARDRCAALAVIARRLTSRQGRVYEHAPRDYHRGKATHGRLSHRHSGGFMSIDITGLSAKELDALINQAKKRKTTLSKRKPIAAVRKKLTELARAEGYTIAELFGGAAAPKPQPPAPAQATQEHQGLQARQGRAEVPQPGQCRGNLGRPRQAAALAGAYTSTRAASSKSS